MHATGRARVGRHLMQTMRHKVGMMVPVWFPVDLSSEQVRETLLATLYDCEHYLPWQHVVLVVDGDARSYRVVRELQAACVQSQGSAFDVIYNEGNRGKGYAVFLGAQWLLERHGLDYFTTRDADGDHVLNDLVNLMRLALALQDAEQTDRLVIIGRRNHPHRALGFVRAEFEALLNRVIVDAVRFALAQQQQVLKTQYFSLLGEYPDLHSGYKLYSRPICEFMVRQPWERPPNVGNEIYRYGVEAVPFVEGTMAGAVVGEITRLTFEPQFSGHDAFARPETNGSVLLWTFLRLGIGVSQAAAILDNHLPRLPLWTTPQGRASLLELRQYVLRRLPQATVDPSSPSDTKAAPYY